MGSPSTSNSLNSSSGGGRRDAFPSGSASLHSSGSFSSKWDGSRSTGMERENLSSSRGGYGGGGGRNWNNSNSPANVYGPDGLGPANKRIEEELFDGVSTSGLNFDKYDSIQIQTLGENVPQPISSFDELNLGAVLVCFRSLMLLSCLISVFIF